MSFDATEKSIENLFDNSNIYQIPRNQRKYVWNETNWNELFSDIEYFVKNNDNLNWSHFLGAIVLNKVNNKTFEIIDGQQRITTIYILMLALYSRMLEIFSESEIGKANKLLITYIYSSDSDGKNQLILDNPDYDKDLRELVHCVIHKEKYSKTNYFSHVYKWFINRIQNFDSKTIQEFYNCLTQATIIEIISNSNEEIYNIFEVLNARGQKLQQFELLKNHILRYLQPKNKDIIDNAKNKWDQIISNLKDEDPDDFLNTFVRVYISKETKNKDGIYQLIKEEIDIADLPKLLDDLVEYSHIYMDITNSKDRNYKYFKIKKNKQIISLLSSIQFLYKQDIIKEKIKDTAFLNLRNFFFLFNILEKTSNSTHHKIKEAAFNVYHCKESNKFKDIMANLFLELNEKLGKWTRKNVKEKIRNSNSLKYTNKGNRNIGNKKLIKYILEEYANYYQTDLPIDDALLTIEHLIPDSKTNQITWNIENLTLTDQNINNKKLKNKSITEKCEILKNSNLKVNNELIQYVNDGNFNYDKRLDDMVTVLINNIFKFDTRVFGKTK